MRQFVVIRDESAGNDSVGEMWQETKVFPEDASLYTVMSWALRGQLVGPSKKRITITLPDES